MIRSPGLALIALILAALGLIFLAAAPSAPPPSARTLRGRPPLQSVLDVPDSPEKLDRTALHVPAFPASYLALSRTLEAAIREAGGSDVDPDFLPLEGHSGQVLPQTMFYSLLIKDNLWIRRVCEVGFNAGLSIFSG